MPDPQQMSDHDLLIEINTKVSSLVAQDADHETRLRRVERILYVGIGLAAALGSGVGSVAARIVA